MRGHYRDAAEVVSAGLALLQRAEAERGASMVSLKTAEAEDERDGIVMVEQLEREMTGVLGFSGRQER